MKELALALRESGQTYAQIAGVMGISKWRAWRWCSGVQRGRKEGSMRTRGAESDNRVRYECTGCGRAVWRRLPGGACGACGGELLESAPKAEREEAKLPAAQRLIRCDRCEGIVFGRDLVRHEAQCRGPEYRLRVGDKWVTAVRR